jgi:hypothetical protein
MTAHIDPTLEALRVRRDAYAASGGEAAVIYDKLRDELVLARQRFSDQEKELATTRLDLRAEVPQGRQGETLVQPPNPADTSEAAVYKELDEAERKARSPRLAPLPSFNGPAAPLAALLGRTGCPQASIDVVGEFASDLLTL